jgi:DNA-binding CsgD family transcriptional regulator
MALPFAAVHQLCAPVLDRVDTLPAPQRAAVHVALGLAAGTSPDRLLIGLALLSLLSEASDGSPVLCVVDDAQWLDRESAQALAFVVRRLQADPVGVVFGVRDTPADLARFPELVVEPLDDGDADSLLRAVLRGPLDEQVTMRVVAETRGNPLALIEWTRGLTAAELAGGFGMPAKMAMTGQIEESFRRRIADLPWPAQQFLTVAAAEPTGDAAIVERAATLLGIRPQDASLAIDAGLVEIAERASFRHPLARSAAYGGALLDDRQAGHRALAQATDADLDPDREAWHRALGSPGPDEDIAHALERSAERAQARGGLAAAAAFLERATALTPDATRRAVRSIAAARAMVQTGAYADALRLLTIADAEPLAQRERVRADLVRAQLAFAERHASDASRLLLQAAKRLERIDADLARLSYLDAFYAAVLAGRLAEPQADLVSVAVATSALPASSTPRASDVLLAGLTRTFTEAYTAGVPGLRAAVAAAGDAMFTREEMRRLALAFTVSNHLWDDVRSETIARRWTEFLRDAGALGELSVALSASIVALAFKGDLAAAALLVAEVRAASEASGNAVFPLGVMAFYAIRGDEEELGILTRVALADAMRRREGLVISVAEWATAVLNNGLGRYSEALAAARRASENVFELGWANRALVELVEAAARVRDYDAAVQPFDRLSEITSASGTDWALGVEARSRALLSDGAAAEGLHHEAIERLGRTRIRTDLARAHLLYGEWLRREHRRVDARAQLRIAHDMFTAMGMLAFCARARHELLATGETVRKRTVEPRDSLTPQEAHIAELAVEGLTNPEIGAQLFISHRTVEFHLRKVFTKLGVTSRRQLRDVLPSEKPA